MIHCMSIKRVQRVARCLIVFAFINLVVQKSLSRSAPNRSADTPKAIDSGERTSERVIVNQSSRMDESLSLKSLARVDMEFNRAEIPVQIPSPTPTPQMTPVTAASAALEQKSHGTNPGPKLVESFDGLGFGFE